MLRALCLACLVLAVPLSSARAEAPADLAANAALKYWQGFAKIPTLSKDEQKKLLADSLTRPLDAPTRALVDQADYALLMMHRGAALRWCEWSVGSEEGIRALLPHAEAARVLTSLACLRARIRFEEGRNAEAIDDIVDGMSLSRHVSQGGLLIAVLVGYDLERRMSLALVPYLPRLDAGLVKDLKTRIAALPPGGTPAKAMELEVRFLLDWLAREVKQPKDKEGLLTLLGEMCGSPEDGRSFLERCGGDVDGVLKSIDMTRGSFARMGAKLDRPLNQFLEELDRERKKQAANPVFLMFFPGLDKVRWAQARADVQRALLAAALDVRLEGPEALKSHPDPVVGGPFEYVPFDGGFELRSKLVIDKNLPAKWQLDEGFNKPLVVTVGRRGR